MLDIIKREFKESKLLKASVLGDFETAKNMIENNGINIDVKSFFTRRTPVMHAAINRHEHLMEYFINKNANLKLKDELNENVITYAIKNKVSERICLKLIEKTKWHDSVDEDGRSLLHLAIIYKRTNLLNYLFMGNYISVDVCDNKGITPLMCAIENGNLSIIKRRIEEGGIDFENVLEIKKIREYALKTNNENIIDFIKKLTI